MSLDLFLSIIEQASALGVFDVRLFLRGEPLLHKEIDKMVVICKQKNIKTEIHTNGMLLTKDKGKKLLDAGVDMVSFSIDGLDKEYYERYRVGAKLDRTVNNVIEFLKLKKAHRLKKTMD